MAQAAHPHQGPSGDVIAPVAQEAPGARAWEVSRHWVGATGHSACRAPHDGNPCTGQSITGPQPQPLAQQIHPTAPQNPPVVAVHVLPNLLAEGLGAVLVHTHSLAQMPADGQGQGGAGGREGRRAAEVALTKRACGGRPRAPKHAAWPPGLCSAWPPAACSACHANTPGGRVAHCQQALQGDATGAHQVLAQHRLQHRLRSGNEKSVIRYPSGMHWCG